MLKYKKTKYPNMDKDYKKQNIQYINQPIKQKISWKPIKNQSHQKMYQLTKQGKNSNN